MMDIIENKIKEIVKNNFELDIPVAIEIPSIEKHGDYSCNVALRLSGMLDRKPLDVAEEIKNSLPKWDFLEKIEIAPPGFINFYLDDNKLTARTLSSIFDNSLISTKNTKEKVIVEHTSVNPNKAMHVGHIRNAILGDSIVRLLKRVGYSVETHNYIDDTGVQVADTVNGLLNLGLISPKEQKFDDFCWDVYTQINKEYETNENLLNNRKNILQAIEHDSGGIAEKSKEVVDRIVGCHLELMDTFGINYDLLVYESDIIGFGFWETAFEQLKKSPNFVFEKDGDNKGCWVLKYDTEKFGDKIFVRSDGTKVYTAKDTAYHLWKFGLLDKNFLYKKWDSPKFLSTWRTHINGEENSEFGHANKIVNIIDERQTYPQEMVKHALHSLGYKEQADNYVHIAYGVVSLSKDTAEALGVDVSTEKDVYAMSGRKGIGVKVTDLLALLEKSIKEIQDQSKNGDGAVEQVDSKDIAIGAIKHYMLKNNPNSEVLFDFNQALQLVGNTGPYLQYSSARASSILRKDSDFTPTYHKQVKLTESERGLISKLSEFPLVLEKTLEEFNISMISNYAFDLSKAFHSFYEHNNVLKAEDSIKEFRLTLVKAYSLVITDVLDILGIVAPEKM